MYKIGTRVEVFDGTGKKRLGLGTYVGDVDLYAVGGYTADNQASLLSNHGREEEPISDADAADMAQRGGLTNYKVRTLRNNPKLQLDDGSVVYGCQVWWRAIEEKPNGAEAHAG